MSNSKGSHNHTYIEEDRPPYTVLDGNEKPHIATTSQLTQNRTLRRRVASVWRSLCHWATPLKFADSASREAIDSRRASQYGYLIPKSFAQGPFRQPFVRSSKQGFFRSPEELWKFQIRSLHFPVEHHYLENGKNTPWIARVRICVNNPNMFCTTILGVKISSLSVMFRRRLVLNRLSDTSSEDAWSVFIDLWSRDWNWLAGDGAVAKVRQLVNLKTNVAVVGWMYQLQHPAPPIPQRFFVKYTKPLSSPAWQDATDTQKLKISENGSQTLYKFCVDPTPTLDVNLPRLRQIVEERYEEHFFGR
ncbi:hypothetical protein V8F20_003922 [Naviculisporaceae sp. PSN 640]